MNDPGPSNPTLSQFADFVESIPPRLGLWRTASRAELWPLIAWLNVWSVQEMRETTHEVGAMMAAKLRHAELHNTVGVGVIWLLRYLRENPLARGSEDMERKGFARRAGQVWSIRDLVKSAHAGVYDYQTNGRRLHFEFAGDTELEALDNVLELVDELWRVDKLRTALREGTEEEGPSLQELLLTNGINVPWEEAPEDVRIRFRHRAMVLVQELRRLEVPRAIRIGGFTFADALGVWQELLAAAAYRHVCLMLGAQNPLMACPAISLDDLVDQLGPSGVDDDHIAEVVEFLTFDVDCDTDPCLAPIIPINGKLAPLSALITPGAPDRNILARLRADPSRFGGIGKELGRIGSATVAEGLSRVSGTLCAKEVKIRDQNGRPAGDLDVVSIDPVENLIAVFEVKWQLEPDGASEIDKVEIQATQGQAQLARIASGLANGSLRVKWPPGYPDTSTYKWEWFVITSNVIPVVRGTSGTILARSHRVLTHMALRVGASLREVCDLLAKPAIPPTADERVLESISHRFWNYEITVRRPR